MKLAFPDGVWNQNLAFWSAPRKPEELPAEPVIITGGIWWLGSAMFCWCNWCYPWKPTRLILLFCLLKSKDILLSTSMGPDTLSMFSVIIYFMLEMCLKNFCVELERHIINTYNIQNTLRNNKITLHWFQKCNFLSCLGRRDFINNVSKNMCKKINVS